MPRDFRDLLAELPADQQAEIERQGAEAIGQEYALRRLREAIGQTQVELAARMGIGQSALSRLERKNDHYLSTMIEYVEGLGGRLEITVTFPGREPVKLAIGEPATDARPQLAEATA